MLKSGLPPGRLVGLGTANNDAELLGRERRDAIAQGEVGVDKAGLRQQVARRVAGRGQFRQQQQVRARAAGLAGGIGDLREVLSNAPTVKFN